jgi:hypothetical protein
MKKFLLSFDKHFDKALGVLQNSDYTGFNFALLLALWTTIVVLVTRLVS